MRLRSALIGLAASAALVLGTVGSASAASTTDAGWDDSAVERGTLSASYTDVTVSLRIDDYSAQDTVMFVFYREGSESGQHQVYVGPDLQPGVKSSRLYNTDDYEKPIDKGAVGVARTFGARGTLKMVVPWRLLGSSKISVQAYLYRDDTPYPSWMAGGADGPWSVAVSKAAPTVTAKLSSTSIKKGSKKTVKVSVSVSHNVAGTVTVYRGSKKLGSGKVTAGKTKSVTLSNTKKLGTGSQKLTVKFVPSDSGKYAQVTKTLTLKVTKK